MIELRSLRLAGSNLSDVGLNFKPLNHRELIRVVRQVGACCAVANVLLPKMMHDSN